ncbi:alpha-tocopherol transfer protein [Diabrotica virgifera virgifera]|uniref:Alpha-tocopherol transfer protein-like n=1 Tax=Diabrotica virgifera virgifera TaxID=50390 RepID=A0A6P7FGN7_DIAVI|nr:alpha-tocopherol transfer protein [Diabrotica virgifera virgifera]
MPSNSKKEIPPLTEDQQHAIKSLRKRIEDELNHIKNINTKDTYLLRFLYCTDFNTELGFKKIKDYYENILAYPKWYSTDPPIKIKPLIDKNISVMVPASVDKDDRQIYLFKVGNVDIQNISIQEISFLDDIWFEYLLENEPHLSGKGICIIVDFEYVTWKFAKWFNYRNVKIGFKKLALVPFKEIKIHFVNNSKSMKYFLKLIVSCVPEDIKKQVHFHFSDQETLAKHIDKDFLLPEHGGYNKLNYTRIYKSLFEINDIIASNLNMNKNDRNS